MTSKYDENVVEVPNDVITNKELAEKDASGEKPAGVKAETLQEKGGSESHTNPSHKKTFEDWFKEWGWDSNPFTFSITPSLFVGYIDQVQALVNAIKTRHKVMMAVGPTGSGKTTLLKWLTENVNKTTDTIYLGKIPESPEEFVFVFNEKYKAPWFLRWLIPNIKNVYQIPDFLDRKLKNKHLIILCDEVHEANQDVLEWLRVLSDQIKNVSLILSGLPVFEDNIREKLETLRKRVTTKIELISLTKEETRELIEKRIADAGGRDIVPFLPETIDAIYERTGGFPREIIRMCDMLVMSAIKNNRHVITPDMIKLKEEAPKEGVISLQMLDDITTLQKKILESVSARPLTPGQIVNLMDAKKYKSRQHAVRSVNNILKRMMDENMVERRRSGRAFVYVISAKLKTMFVKS